MQKISGGKRDLTKQKERNIRGKWVFGSLPLSFLLLHSNVVVSFGIGSMCLPGSRATPILNPPFPPFETPSREEEAGEDNQGGEIFKVVSMWALGASGSYRNSTFLFFNFLCCVILRGCRLGNRKISLF